MSGVSAGYRFSVGGQNRHIRKVDKHTDKEFIGTYKSHEIHCWLDGDDFEETDRRFYIQVTAPDGCYVYDGWMPEDQGDTLDAAIQDAVRGACL